MSNKVSFHGSSSINSVLFRVSPNSRSFFSQFVMIITVFLLLVAFLPCVSSSPTPPSTPTENNNNKIMYDSNAFMLDPNDYQIGDSSSLSSAVQEQPFTAHSPSSFWYAQPRKNANQFLMSHVNNNEVIVPKWFTRLNDDDDDDIDDYVPAGLTVNKRSSYYNRRGYPLVKKRKQLAKPPMEVMNEIVNSIYLKR